MIRAITFSAHDAREPARVWVSVNTALCAPAGGQFTEEYDEKTQHGLMKDLMRSDRTENAHQQVPDDR